MKPIILFLYCCFFTFNPCQAQEKKETKEQNKTQTEKSEPMKQPFDLLNLTFNEDILTILTSAGLQLKDNEETDALTLLGYKKFESTSSKLLTFNGKDLSGTNKKERNNIILYYAEEDNLEDAKENSLGMYQVNLFTSNKADILFNNIENKFGNPKTYELGNIKTFLWVKNDLCFYYFTKDPNENSQDFYRVLFVFNKNNKQWVNFIGALGFSLNLSDALKE
ncbi:hypothetical protein [Apibacter adventoris]|uniref:Uncharacterized protein n=1 Tax=Apibacter adventoris TaxID=1679466 RepID=A0A2S8ACN7_9FLAO|nr:hypothetical protein [Apibacter adventoris]PQL92358.1 hypothetical protein C4S77_06715 [Apibacter adventoris]